MNKKIYFSIALSLLFLAGGHLQAQTAKETKQYTKVVAKPNVKALNKFLETFPSSVYTDEIKYLRDSLVYAKVNTNDAIDVEDFLIAYPGKFTKRAQEVLDILNTPLTSQEEAESFAAEAKGRECDGSMTVLRYRARNTEHIVVFEIIASDLDYDMIRISSYASDGKEFNEEYTKEISKYIMDDHADCSVLTAKPAITFIDGKRLMQLEYLNYSSQATEINLEYVINLISTDAEEYSNSIFYGMNIGAITPKAYGAYTIEGRSPENLAQGGLSYEQIYMLELMSRNPSLKQISEEDSLSDDAIQWWKEQNPNAMTSAKTLNFGNIPDNCSLVSEYKRLRKESSKQYSAVVMDFRGYTAIVSYSKSTGKYSLVWVEPICKNRNTDRFLSDIYFESNGTTLDLFYYKGKTTFKYYINLSSKTIRR